MINLSLKNWQTMQRYSLKLSSCPFQISKLLIDISWKISRFVEHRIRFGVNSIIVPHRCANRAKRVQSRVSDWQLTKIPAEGRENHENSDFIKNMAQTRIVRTSDVGRRDDNFPTTELLMRFWILAMILTWVFFCIINYWNAF